MKTARQWADHLPEPIRTQFLENCEKEGRLDKQYSSIERCVGHAFTWSNTPQGNEYWNNIFINACDGKYNELPLNITLSEVQPNQEPKVEKIKLLKGRFVGTEPSMQVVYEDADGMFDSYEFRTLEKLKKLIAELPESENSIRVIIPHDWEFEPFESYIEFMNNNL